MRTLKDVRYGKGRFIMAQKEENSVKKAAAQEAAAPVSEKEAPVAVKAAPAKEPVTAAKKVAPVMKETAPAAKEAAPAVKETAPAAKEAAPAAKQTAPAAKETAATAKKTASASKGTTASTKKTASAKKETALTAKKAEAPGKKTTSTKKKAASAKKETGTMTEKTKTAETKAEPAQKQEAAPITIMSDLPRRSVAFIGSECHPFVKTGGLGDVMYALPRELVRLNCDVRVILPRYACIPQKYQDKMVYRGEFYMDLGKTGRNYYVGIMEYICDGVVYDFIDNQEFFTSGNPYVNLVDDIPKYCFFSKAALAALNYMNWIPDIIHCHDWQAALVPVYLRTLFQDSPVGHARSHSHHSQPPLPGHLQHSHHSILVRLTRPCV